MRLIYEKLNPQAHAPSKAFPLDAGWDLRALSPYALKPGVRMRIRTGLAVKLQPSPQQEASMAAHGLSWYLRIADKSGLAAETGIHILGGVVDRNYRGEIVVIVANLGFWQDTKLVQNHWNVMPGDKVAQLVPELILDVREASEEPVGDSDRNADGFGSTGR